MSDKTTPAETMPKQQVTNKLSAIRKQRGISAAALASTIGVTRQTIYAIESGTYIPNTAVALRLARTLGIRMEELFALADGSIETEVEAMLLPSSDTVQLGQQVQLCQVNNRLVATAVSPAGWYLPASDGAVIDGGSNGGHALVKLHEQEEKFEKRIMLAGCDPAMSLVTRHVRSAGIELVMVQQNSSRSLALLKGGYVHVAGSHLKGEKSADANIGAVNKLFHNKTAAIFSFAIWQEGLVTAAGNPKHMRGVEDLSRKDITLVNREAGSGSRALLDKYLKRLDIQSTAVRGYESNAPGHLAAAWHVKAGLADCCIATEASAKAFGLHFISLEAVRYDWVISSQSLNSAAVQVLIDALSHLSLRKQLDNTGAYDTSVTGNRVQ